MTHKIYFIFFVQSTKGKLAVIGSVHIFNDQYIDKEENSKVQVSISVLTSTFHSIIFHEIFVHKHFV